MELGGGKLEGDLACLFLEVDDRAARGFLFLRVAEDPFLASSSLEKSLRMTGPPVNRFPKRTRQYFFPRPLTALPTPTPGGRSLILAFMVILIRHLYAAVNCRVKSED